MDTYTAARDLLRRVLTSDLQLVWELHCYGFNILPLRSLLSKIVNAQPLRDISLVTWCVFIAYLPELGLPLFYACTANLLAAAVLRVVVRAPRPFEFDARLKPLADRYEGSYGFPSLESYMAVVVYGLIWNSQPSFLLGLIFICLAGLIGYTRVYACSRFVHQIMGSWLLGLVGLQVTMAYVDKLHRVHFPPGTHVALVAFIAIGVAAYIAYHSEMNESYLLKLPKEEYTRVLKDILDQDVWAAMERDYEEYGTESAREGGGYKATGGANGGRRDSFYYLEQSVARRKTEQARAAAGEGVPKMVRWADQVHATERGEPPRWS